VSTPIFGRSNQPKRQSDQFENLVIELMKQGYDQDGALAEAERLTGEAL
jgi:hypothetical protein